MTIIEYVTEEVSRQGHDVTAIDGLERVQWMLRAWVYALTSLKKEPLQPLLSDAERIGKMVEPVKNGGGWRQCQVRVGYRICPDYHEVPTLLVELFESKGLSPLEFYRQFLEIHPFVDGNGRTGKVLLNWMNGTLHDPIFPPSDLFGHPIRNP